MADVSWCCSRYELCLQSVKHRLIAPSPICHGQTRTRCRRWHERCIQRLQACRADLGLLDDARIRDGGGPQVWYESRTYHQQPNAHQRSGVVSQMPVVGAVSNPLLDLGVNRSAADQAEVGYYRSDLVSGTTIEVAATNHAGMYQYSFPGENNSVVVDVSHVLPSSED